MRGILISKTQIAIWADHIRQGKCATTTYHQGHRGKQTRTPHVTMIDNNVSPLRGTWYNSSCADKSNPLSPCGVLKK